MCMSDTLASTPRMAWRSTPARAAGSGEMSPAPVRPTPPVPIRQSSAPAATMMERSYSLPVATQREFESQWQSVSQRVNAAASAASLPVRRSVARPRALCLSNDTPCTYSPRVSSTQEPTDQSAVLCNSSDCWWSYGWPSCGNGMAVVSPVRATHTPSPAPTLEDETDSPPDSAQSHLPRHMSWIPEGLENELSNLRSCKTPPPQNYEWCGNDLTGEVAKPGVGPWVSSQVDEKKLPPLPASSLAESMSKHARTLAAATQKRFFPPIKCEPSRALSPATAAKGMGSAEPLSFYIHPDHV
ncbi:Hypothetical protein MSYG_1135 [Malassezia sympodialis ATCC 42132]|uniref:Uncharacterized protein n=1 Tax=Malassezia sympodialis (strain ATCC 42132) TaxID=1230383 RepID=A0A1M8A2Z3_MALS4|nr:Hypothetical protein MSYG_1135 [Malassezia sympodialis ATCC 42132]